MALALAHPTLETLGANPEFFLARAAPRRDAVLTAVTLGLVAPALVVAATWLAHRVAGWLGAVVHALAFGGGVALAAHLLIARSTGLGTGAALAVAAVVGIAAVGFHHAADGVRAAASWLALVPAASLALFVVASPTGRMLRAGDGDPVTAAGVVADTPVALVVLDEFPTTSLLDRRGELDTDRFPHFAELAADGVWYRNATTVSALTELAAPAIFSGLAPQGGRIPSIVDHPDNLMTRLAGSHDLTVRESVTQLCPPQACAGPTSLGPSGLSALATDVATVGARVSLPEPWVVGLPAIDAGWNQFRADVLADAGRAAGFDDVPDMFEAAEPAFIHGRAGDLDGLVEPTDGRPGFWMAHTLLPHRPWEYTPDGLRHPSGASTLGLVDGVWRDDEALVAQGQARHLQQAAFVDRLLGELFGRLRALGEYERTLIVVVADHGVAFVPGEDHRVPERDNVGAIVDVPLFVKYPAGDGPRGVVDERFATILDVAPTVYDVLGVDVADLDGRSLLAPPPADQTPPRLWGDGRWPEVAGWTPDQKRARAAEQAARVGGDDPGALWRVGPHTDLVGRTVEELATGDRVPGEVAYDAEDALRTAAAERGLAPSVVVGTITGDEATPAGGSFDVALTVDGRVAGVGLADPSGPGATAFSVLVDPDPWPGGFGRSELRLWKIVDGGRLVGYGG